jgi:hypothetical protein
MTGKERKKEKKRLSGMIGCYLNLSPLRVSKLVSEHGLLSDSMRIVEIIVICKVAKVFQPY